MLFMQNSSTTAKLSLVLSPNQGVIVLLYLVFPYMTFAACTVSVINNSSCHNAICSCFVFRSMNLNWKMHNILNHRFRAQGNRY